MRLPLSGGTINEGNFISPTLSFYSGYISTLSNITPTRTYTYTVGFLMSLDNSNTCLTFTNTYGTVTNLASGGTFTTTAPASTSSTHDLVSYAISLTTITISNLITNAFCVP